MANDSSAVPKHPVPPCDDFAVPDALPALQRRAFGHDAAHRFADRARRVRDSVGHPRDALRESRPYDDMADAWRAWAAGDEAWRAWCREHRAVVQRIRKVSMVRRAPAAQASDADAVGRERRACIEAVCAWCRLGHRLVVDHGHLPGGDPHRASVADCLVHRIGDRIERCRARRIWLRDAADPRFMPRTEIADRDAAMVARVAQLQRRR